MSINCNLESFPVEYRFRLFTHSPCRLVVSDKLCSNCKGNSSKYHRRIKRDLIVYIWKWGQHSLVHYLYWPTVIWSISLGESTVARFIIWADVSVQNFVRSSFLCVLKLTPSKLWLLKSVHKRTIPSSEYALRVSRLTRSKFKNATLEWFGVWGSAATLFLFYIGKLSRWQVSFTWSVTLVASLSDRILRYLRRFKEINLCALIFISWFERFRLNLVEYIFKYDSSVWNL